MKKVRLHEQSGYPNEAAHMISWENRRLTSYKDSQDLHGWHYRKVAEVVGTKQPVERKVEYSTGNPVGGKVFEYSHSLFYH